MLTNKPSTETLNWEAEAEAIIRDVKDHVSYIGVSKKLKSSSSQIFLNLTTLENKNFCIRASGNGFKIIAEEFDKITLKEPTDDEEEEIFEIPYALLNKISPSYVTSFGNQLVNILENLEQEAE